LSDKKITQNYIEHIADLLWISKYTGSKKSDTPKGNDEPPTKADPQPPEDPTPPISDPKTLSGEREQNDKQDEQIEIHITQENSAIQTPSTKKAKAFSSPKKLELSNYREWEKAFKFINLKRYSNKKFEIDIDKTVEAIATTEIFDIKYQRVLEKCYSLTIIIDKSSTMELWQELIRLFIKMLKTTAVFHNVNIYYWDTAHKQPILYYDKDFKQKIDSKSIPNGDKELLWVLSDCLAPSWKSGSSFKQIKYWSKYSFISLIQMFPKHMWMGTMLYKGIHTRFKSLNKIINNDTLYTDIKTDENSLKLPIISFEPFSLQAWAKVVANSFDNSISGIILNNYEFETITNHTTPTTQDILDRFYTQASPLAQKLAFYMSILPIDFQVVRILQEEKLPQTNQSHVAEVFLGGLIKREKIENKIIYSFYPNIREKLSENLPISESLEVLEKMSNFLTNHLGEAFNFKALISDPKGVFQGDIPLSDESIAFAKIVSKVLHRAGGEFANISNTIDKTIHIFDNTELINKVKNYLKDREFEEIWNETVYIGGNPKDGDYIEGTVSQYGTFEDNIEFLDIDKIDKDHYNIQASFGTLCFVEIYDYPYPQFTKEVELYLDVEATIEVKLVSGAIDELNIENITIDDVDISQIDDLIKDEAEQERTQAIIPQSKRFQMGSNEYYNEKPIHEVVINYDFEISKYPVTFEEYDLFCEDTGKKKPDDIGWGRGRRPVINVSWEEAKEYCKWLNKKLGLGEKTGYYRLPTEAEWEYSCRADTTTKWSFGDDEKELDKYAWYNNDNSDSKTHPVGKKEPNPWGLYDMHGNVWEYCEDDYVDNYNDTPRDGTAHVDKKADYKVLRGGSWVNYAYYARSSSRMENFPDYRNFFMGFRLLRVIKGKSESESEK